MVKKQLIFFEMPTQYPKASIPPHICSDVPGSWAYDTMSRRVREDILARVFRENNFDPHSIARLQALENELLNASKTFLSPLPDDGGPDVIMWNQHILEHPIASKQTWLSAPFAVAEFYL